MKRLARRSLLWTTLVTLGLASACLPGGTAGPVAPPVNPGAFPAATMPAQQQPSVLPEPHDSLKTLESPESQATSQAYLSLVSKPFQATANPVNPAPGDSLSTGQPATLPAYIPDSEIIFGPSALDFEITAYLQQAGGALFQHREYLASSGWTSAGDIVERVALENSVNPRLLLALLEYQCACVLGSAVEPLQSGYVLGVEDYHWKGLYGQLWWAANQLAAGFYGWHEGWLKELALPDGSLLQPAAGANPGSVALQVYFSRLWAAHDQSAKMGAQTWAALHPDAFGEIQWRQALDSQAGFTALYQQMFGDPQERAALVEPLLPPDLHQPVLILPFEPGRLWSFTSGPHKAWERESSLAAVDFAPASDRTGCLETDAWVTAVGDGPVVRIGKGIVVQDLDGAPAGNQPSKSDRNEQTGWAILYMHIASNEQVKPGTYLRAGQRIGHPSCEGGPATGTHLHLARKYNGMWVAAGGSLPLTLDGWTVRAGEQPYQGIMIKDGQVINARQYASFDSHISRPEDQPAGAPTGQPASNDNDS